MAIVSWTGKLALAARKPFTIAAGPSPAVGPEGTGSMKSPPAVVLCGLALIAPIGPLSGMFTQPATVTAAAATRQAHPSQPQGTPRGPDAASHAGSPR